MMGPRIKFNQPFSPITTQKALWIASFVLPVLVASVLIGVTRPALGQGVTDLVVYDDALASGWQDWSWGTTVDLSNTSPVYSGTTSIAATYTAAWGGLYLHADSVDVSAYDTLRFWLHGGGAGGQDISVSIDYNGSSYQITATAGAWQEVEIPLAELGSPTAVSDLVWQDSTGSAQPTFYLDQVAFVDTGTTPPPPPLPVSGPALSVDVATGRHPISPYIYGMNFADEDLADELGLPVRRRGGNSTTRYNWQTDVHNVGSDWYYENIPGDNAYSPSLPDGSASDLFVEQDGRTGSESILTTPLIGWTPKSGASAHPYDCGFKVSVYGSQDSVDPWDTDCGNGLQGGVHITGNDPADTSIPISTAFVTSWIDHLTGKYGTAANGGVMFYNLDNEPMLWNSTHRDVHPEPVDYDEMRDRTYDYGAAIKAADPTAQTLGPVVWGWCAYFFSAADGCSAGADHASHGDTDFVPWYLQQMIAYEQANGVRILDYLDLHYYPQASGVALSPAGNAQTQALRLRSTRSLWDPSYQDESWISDTTDEPIQFIPRMKQWVADNYPGTKLAITEYNWGALDHINGTLAQADVLGIFGREGLDLATLWGPPNADQPGAYAFRMYLNYDGLGSAFGETSVHAASADQGQLAIYAAQRNDTALTLMVINKTGDALTSTVTLSNFQPAANAQVYRYSSANLDAIVREVDQPMATGGFTATFPANSITLLVAPSQTPSQPDLTPSYKAVSSSFANYGDRVTYTAVVDDNTGPLTPTILFTDTLPEGLAYIPGTLAATTGTVDDADAPTLRWSGVLTPAPVATITYAVIVTHGVSGTSTLILPQVITNTAFIAVSGHEPITRAATVRVNWHNVYLPLVMSSEASPGAGVAARPGPASLAPQAASAVTQAPDCDSADVTCYYVCDCASGADGDCVAGDDAAAGTVDAPWQSYERARAAFGTIAPGDAIQFCSGGAWDVSGGDRWVNRDCEASDRCWVGDYVASWASGDEGRPIIRRTDGADGFALEDGGDAEHEEGYIFENLDIRGSGDGAGFFLYNDIDDVEIRSVSIQGFRLGVHLGGSNPCSAGDPECDGQNQRITLRDSTIIDNASQGWLGASSGTQLIDNTFENNGSSAVFDHNIYVSGSSGGQTSGIRVIGNRLYRSAMVDGECRGVPLVVHGQHDGLLIEGNEVWEDVGHAGQGCWGIAVDNGYGSAEGFTNVVVRGNIVRNVGNMAIGVGACADCLIENNVIIHEQDFGITAIAAPDRDLGPGDLPQDNITVRNNAIYIGPNSGGNAISVRDMGDNHQIVSNAVMYAGSSSSFNCLRVDLDPSAYDEIDYNLCHFSNAGEAEWADGVGSLSEWQTATGFDSHSAQADPGFADPSNGDLAAASASARMVDGGHPSLSSPIDIAGNARDARPDVGAYEFVPALSLHGRPADQAIHLSWYVTGPLPPTSTWQIDYRSQTGTLYPAITGIFSPTRVYTLTNLTNGVWYTVTLSAVQGTTVLLSDLVRVMPGGFVVYLPLVLKGN